jgi:hypothetical protein
MHHIDVTEYIYIQNWMVTEIIMREKYDALVIPRTVLLCYATQVHHFADS